MFKIGDKVLYTPRISFPYEIPCSIHKAEMVSGKMMYTLAYCNGYFQSSVDDTELRIDIVEQRKHKLQEFLNNT